MIYDTVSSQLDGRTGAPADAAEPDRPARKRNTRHAPPGCVTYRQKRLNIVPALNALPPMGITAPSRRSRLPR